MITAAQPGSARDRAYAALAQSADIVLTATVDEALTMFNRECMDSELERNLRRLIEAAFTMGLELGWSDLGDSVRGLYLHAQRRILLNTRMRAFQVICTLSHELVHAAYGDHGGSDLEEARAEFLGAAIALDPVLLKRSVEHTGKIGLTVGALAALRSGLRTHSSAPAGDYVAFDRPAWMSRAEWWEIGNRLRGLHRELVSEARDLSIASAEPAALCVTADDA